MLPPICTSRPARRRIWVRSAVVVDFPLVPVMATKGACRAIAARSRQNSSMSPMISIPCALARPTVQCGSGCVSGTPGASTRASNPDQSALLRSPVSMSCALAASIRAGLSSQASTRAPPAFKASAVARPDPPSPKRASERPAMQVTGVIGSPQLQRRQAYEGQHDRNDPEANDDLRLLPPLLLEVMVDRGHPEDALAGELERANLDDDR